MRDVVLDTSVIGDVLAQYFDDSLAARGAGEFVPQNTITAEIAHELNRVTGAFRRSAAGFAVGDPHAGGLIVASALAFVELARKWSEIALNRFTIVQLEAFMTQSPEWFNLAPVDESLVPFYVTVPEYVYDNGRPIGVEWCDAIHVATMLSRGAQSLLITTDQRLRLIDFLRDRILP
jgi:hypothetical protein